MDSGDPGEVVIECGYGAPQPDRRGGDPEVVGADVPTLSHALGVERRPDVCGFVVDRDSNVRVDRRLELMALLVSPNQPGSLRIGVRQP